MTIGDSSSPTLLLCWPKELVVWVYKSGRARETSELAWPAFAGKIDINDFGQRLPSLTPNGLSLFIHRVMMGEENDDNNVRIIKASNRSF